MSLEVPPWLAPKRLEARRPPYTLPTEWKDPKRWAHADLPEKPVADLAVEIAQAEGMLGRTRRGLARAWLQQRIHECRREIERRKE